MSALAALHCFASLRFASHPLPPPSRLVAIAIAISAALAILRLCSRPLPLPLPLWLVLAPTLPVAVLPLGPAGGSAPPRSAAPGAGPRARFSHLVDPVQDRKDHPGEDPLLPRRPQEPVPRSRRLVECPQEFLSGVSRLHEQGGPLRRVPEPRPRMAVDAPRSEAPERAGLLVGRKDGPPPGAGRGIAGPGACRGPIRFAAIPGVGFLAGIVRVPSGSQIVLPVVFVFISVFAFLYYYFEITVSVFPELVKGNDPGGFLPVVPPDRQGNPAGHGGIVSDRDWIVPEFCGGESDRVALSARALDGAVGGGSAFFVVVVVVHGNHVSVRLFLAAIVAFERSHTVIRTGSLDIVIVVVTNVDINPILVFIVHILAVAEGLALELGLGLAFVVGTLRLGTFSDRSMRRRGVATVDRRWR